MTLHTTEYIATARRIENEASAALRPVSLYTISTFTADLLKPYILVEGAARGLRVDATFGPFNQLEQQVLGDSALYASKPDVVMISARIEDLCPVLAREFVTLGRKRIEAEISAVADRIKSFVEAIRKRSATKILLWNFVEPRTAWGGMSGTLLDPSPAAAIRNLNEMLAGVARAFSDVFIFDCARLATQVGLDNWFDQRMFHLGRIPFTSTAQIAIGRHLARTIRAALTTPAKCLVLDLDNTLWGGVIGEDGMEGIHLGEDFPGSVFKEFQRYVRSLKQRGIILAIASKNNEADALEAIDGHADMVLRREDFAVMRINWDDKVTSLRSIAKQLNMGTDALVFFDDNPVEREWVRSQMPELRVIDVPEQPLHYIDALDSDGCFDQLVIVAEDLRKAEQYREQAQREELQTRADSLDDFLQQLGTVVSIGAVERESLPRFTQLINKTNQFNLTTPRYSAAEVEGMVAKGALAIWLRAKDNFGDNGLVGAAIVMPESDRIWRIDTLLLSCRVIGRHVETAFLTALGRLVRRKNGAVLQGRFIATKKNDMVREFYPKHGFVPDGEHWKIALNGDALPAPPAVEIVMDEEKIVGQ